MNSPIRVALFAGTYLPGYKGGGPTISLSRIVETDSSADIRIITSDRDLGDTEPYEGIDPRSWHTVGRGLVAYLRPGFKDWLWVLRDLRAWQPDLVYINSLQSPWFALLPLIARRLRMTGTTNLLLAPRGECSPGALNIKSPKKRLARPFIKMLIGSNVTWHASSNNEVSDIKQWWRQTQPESHRLTVVLANPAPTPLPACSQGHAGDKTIVTFASRVDPMKGLDLLLLGLASTTAAFELQVFGVISDPKYWEKCLKLAESLPPSVSFRYAGEYQPEDAKDIFAQSDLFVLPTQGENFGHAIAEAMAAGCPTAISSHTIWTSTAEAGGYIADTPEEWRAAIEQFCSLAKDDRNAMRKRTWHAYKAWFVEHQDSDSLFDDAQLRLTDHFSKVPSKDTSTVVELGQQ